MVKIDGINTNKELFKFIIERMIEFIDDSYDEWIKLPDEEDIVAAKSFCDYLKAQATAELKVGL